MCCDCLLLLFGKDSGWSQTLWLIPLFLSGSASLSHSLFLTCISQSSRLRPVFAYHPQVAFPMTASCMSGTRSCSHGYLSWPPHSPPWLPTSSSSFWSSIWYREHCLCCSHLCHTVDSFVIVTTKHYATFIKPVSSHFNRHFSFCNLSLGPSCLGQFKENGDKLPRHSNE